MKTSAMRQSRNHFLSSVRSFAEECTCMRTLLTDGAAGLCAKGRLCTMPTASVPCLATCPGNSVPTYWVRVTTLFIIVQNARRCLSSVSSVERVNRRRPELHTLLFINVKSISRCLLISQSNSIKCVHPLRWLCVMR